MKGLPKEVDAEVAESIHTGHPIFSSAMAIHRDGQEDRSSNSFNSPRMFEIGGFVMINYKHLVPKSQFGMNTTTSPDSHAKSAHARYRGRGMTHSPNLIALKG
jgi:hypothetical protein